MSSTFRESALLAAIPPPPRLTRGSQPKVKYPFVFDAYSEAQQSSAYIGGNKVKCSLVLSHSFLSSEGIFVKCATLWFFPNYKTVFMVQPLKEKTWLSVLGTVYPS